MIYVTVVDGRRFYHEVTGRMNLFVDQAIAKKTVDWAGIKTDRANPQSVSVEIRSVTFKEGVMVEKHEGHYSIVPPFDEIEQAEYDARLLKALESVPEELRVPIKLHASEFGKSRDEALLMVEKLTRRIAEAKA